MLAIQNVQDLSIVNIIAVDSRLGPGEELAVILGSDEGVYFSFVAHELVEFLSRNGGVDSQGFIFTANRDIGIVPRG